MGDILNLAIVGGGLYLAYSTGLLDQAGQALVNATGPKQQQGYAKHHKHRREILIPEVIVPVQPRMRLTFA